MSVSDDKRTHRAAAVHFTADILIEKPRSPGSTDLACAEILQEATRASLTFLDDTTKARIGSLAKFSARGRSRLVACHDKSIIGFTDFRGDEIAYLFVRSGSQRSGVGRQLFDAAQRQMGGCVRLLSFKKNEAALRFYLAIGCRIAGEQEGVFFGSRQSNNILIRNTNP